MTDSQPRSLSIRFWIPYLIGIFIVSLNRKTVLDINPYLSGAIAAFLLLVLVFVMVELPNIKKKIINPTVRSLVHVIFWIACILTGMAFGILMNSNTDERRNQLYVSFLIGSLFVGGAYGIYYRWRKSKE